jgi:hypothetical protein
MTYKGIDYTLKMVAPGIWKYRFFIGRGIKIGTTKTGQENVAIQRTQKRIDRELKIAGNYESAWATVVDSFSSEKHHKPERPMSGMSHSRRFCHPAHPGPASSTSFAANSGFGQSGPALPTLQPPVCANSGIKIHDIAEGTCSPSSTS